jgi:Zn-dependent alcohol dehydrogenase
MRTQAAVLWGAGQDWKIETVDLGDPALLELYRRGELQLDEMITNTYTLDEINQGYADLRAGKNIRGVIVFD